MQLYSGLQLQVADIWEKGGASNPHACPSARPSLTLRLFYPSLSLNPNPSLTEEVLPWWLQPGFWQFPMAGSDTSLSTEMAIAYPSAEIHLSATATRFCRPGLTSTPPSERYVLGGFYLRTAVQNSRWWEDRENLSQRRPGLSRTLTST
jgi:hypothetical protein